MRRLLLSMAAVACLLGTQSCQTAGLPVNVPFFFGGQVSEEEKVAQVLEDVRNGMESQRVYQVLAHVAPNYRDSEGRDYAAIREYLTTVMNNYREFRIVRTPPKIRVQGSQARAIESFGTTAEPVNANQYPPINLQGQMAVLLEKQEGAWRIVEWGPLS